MTRPQSCLSRMLFESPLVKLAEWSAVAKAAGQPPLFAADDFDAGLSEGWVGEFFEALPVDTQVLLTTAAPASRYGSARRGSPLRIVEMRQGRAIATPGLRVVVRSDERVVVRSDERVVVRSDERAVEA